MKVTEIRLKIFLLEDIRQEQTYAVLADFIDSCMSKNDTFSKLHKENCFKNYCFDQPYPIEAGGIYKKDKIYTVRVRTVSNELADYFASTLVNHFNNQVKGLTREIRIIPRKHLTDIYTITPAVVKGNNKGEGGYWKNFMSFEAYEERLKSNLIKKYNYITSSKIDEDFDLYNEIQILNHKPIAIPYKGIKLLGDKLSIKVADNEMAQNIMYAAIGTGLCEINSRGCGFVNYKFI